MKDTIRRTASEDLQMTLTLRYVLLWLDSILKGDEKSWVSFLK